MISPVNQAALQSAIQARLAAGSTASKLPSRGTAGVKSLTPPADTFASIHPHALNPAPAAGGAAPAPVAPAAAAAPAAPAITPFLTGDQLLAQGDEAGNYQQAISDLAFGEQQAAANAVLAKQDRERGRVANDAGIDNNAAGRGIFDSSIRQGNINAEDAAALRYSQAQDTGVNDLLTHDLSLHNAQGTGTLDTRHQNALGAFATSAAQNGVAIPGTLPGDNAAPGANVPGAATLRKATGFTSQPHTDSTGRVGTLHTYPATATSPARHVFVPAR